MTERTIVTGTLIAGKITNDDTIIYIENTYISRVQFSREHPEQVLKRTDMNLINVIPSKYKFLQEHAAFQITGTGVENALQLVLFNGYLADVGPRQPLRIAKTDIPDNSLLSDKELAQAKNFGLFLTSNTQYEPNAVSFQ